MNLPDLNFCLNSVYLHLPLLVANHRACIVVAVAAVVVQRRQQMAPEPIVVAIAVVVGGRRRMGTAGDDDRRQRLPPTEGGGGGGGIERGATHKLMPLRGEMGLWTNLNGMDGFVLAPFRAAYFVFFVFVLFAVVVVDGFLVN